MGERPLLGLPGNPVSVFVTLLVIARPYLLACQGANETTPQAVTGIAGFASGGGPREDYLRVRSRKGRLELFPNQSSGVLSSVCWGDGLVCKPVDTDICEGDEVDVITSYSIHYTKLYENCRSSRINTCTAPGWLRKRC